MPALITHHLFGEESIDRLPQGVITSDEERIAFILGNQGPDPFFFHILTPRVSDCTLLAQVMHRSRMSRQFACLRDGVSHLLPRDASDGANRLNVTLLGRQYLGAKTLCRVALDGGQVLQVDAPGIQRYEPGDALWLQVPQSSWVICR